jgi:LPS-assembly protein
MKNKKLFFIIVIFLLFHGSFLRANEEFNFDIAELEITNDGNFFKGLKRGTVSTNNGNLTISADIFEYDKITNILKANGNVLISDLIKDYLIKSENIIYFKNDEIISSKNKTKAFIEKKYEIYSSDIEINRISNIIKSNKKTKIIDNSFTEYNTDILDYSIEEKIFKGKNIRVSTNTNLKIEERDFYTFKDGIFDLQNKNFAASDTKIYLKKNAYDNSENDPRIYGNSSKKINNITEIKKAIFTSCKITDDCPPWSIKASNIVHDLDKSDIIYENPILRLYDFPVFYFPKFIHPDPSVERRSGFLQPQLNDSNILGSSFHVPYFHTLSENKDITFKPTFFDSGIYMFQNEYRQQNEDSNFIANFGLTKGYQTLNESKNSIMNLFLKFTSKLKLDNFINSNLDLTIQKTTQDTFLKIFDTNLIDINKNIKPADQNQLRSEMKLYLEHENYNFDTGFIAYENLSGLNSDRYQYILPYYNFSRNIYQNDFFNFNFSSSGNNDLKETNKLQSIVNNNLDIESVDFFTQLGLKNKFNIYFKNLNTVGKNVENFKSSPQVDLMSIIDVQSSLPLIKFSDETINTLTPKISFRINPGDMNDASNEDRKLDVNNIFDINRLALTDTFEDGKSLTLGLDYKKESLENINNYFEVKLAGVLRDLKQERIPLNSSINQKTSNLFGSVTYALSEKINLDYNFSVDNDLKTFEKNAIGVGFNYNNINAKFNFTEEDGKIGNTNVLENATTLNLNDDNFITFSTRRNRKINFTEYYDLVYEYKNDCLVAGIKYKKSYYQDRDLKPKEDLLLSVTFFPLSQYEQKIDESAYRGDRSIFNIID